jgi:hypothetical protein
MCSALSDERTGPSFVYSAGPPKRSLSRIRIPWDSWPYFTLSDLSLPFSSPPTTRRITVEVFDSASTRVWVRSRRSRSRSLMPVISRHAHAWPRAPMGPMAIYLFNVKTFVFLLSLILLIDKGGVGLFYIHIDWCPLTTPYSTCGYFSPLPRF